LLYATLSGVIVLPNYALMYRVGMRPWERYALEAAAGVAAALDREEAERPRPLGRALDLGCGRGRYTPDLARRGWQAVGVDSVPSAIEAARAAETHGASYAVADVTKLSSTDLGRFDFFLDIGCFQNFDAAGRAAQAEGVTALANEGATLLTLCFGRTRFRSLVGGVSRSDVETAFAGWELLVVEPAGTAGLGWPMSTTRPHWYRLRLRALEPRV
jgi:SAM-dependent methyltransferase